MRYGWLFAVLVGLSAGAAGAANLRPAPIDVFHGPQSSTAQAPPLDMSVYCRATIDATLTGTYSGELRVDGANDRNGPWFPDAPELPVVHGQHSFSVHQPQGGTEPNFAQRETFVVTAAHRFLRFEVTKVHSGQAGGALHLLVSQLPC